MKPFSLLSLSFAAVLGGTTSPEIQANPADEKNSSSKKMNVLMIAVDDLKPLLGCYGDPIAKTPNIDRLASEGTVFTSAYCQQAVSGATRSSLLTGWSPDRTRVWDLKTLIRSQNPEVVTLPQYFAANNYSSAGIGKIFDPRSVDKQQDERSWSVPYLNYEDYLSTDFPKPAMAQYQLKGTRALINEHRKEALGKGMKKKAEIDAYIQKFIKPSTECADVPDNAYADGAIADGAVKYISCCSSEEPFFLAVGFKKPHLPFCAPEKYWNMYNREAMPLAQFRRKAANSPDYAYHNAGELQSYSDIPPIISFSDIENVVIPDDKAKELIHGYYACVSYTDAQIGKVMDALEKSGKKDSTIIVFWGDHGWHLGDHGLWNKHTNFEQATRVPFIIVHPGARAKKISEPVEFLSIFPTLCDLAGIDVPENLDGENLAKVVMSKGKRDKNAPEYAASQFPRGNKMGYSIRTNRYRYTVWVEWTNRNLDIDKVYSEELYDYETDPNETVNFAGDAEHADALKMMKGYWEDYKAGRL